MGIGRKFLELVHLRQPEPRVFYAHIRRSLLARTFHSIGAFFSEEERLKYFAIQENGSRSDRWQIFLMETRTKYAPPANSDEEQTVTSLLRNEIPESVLAHPDGLSGSRVLEIIKPGIFSPLHRIMRHSDRRVEKRRLKAAIARGGAAPV